MIVFLQQIVSHQTEERRARENDKEEQGEREREKERREEERFQDLKETVGKKLVQFSCRIGEVKEEMGRQKISIIQHDHTLSNLQQQLASCCRIEVYINRVRNVLTWTANHDHTMRLRQATQ